MDMCATLPRNMVLIFKVNEYLRAIDRRLGNPTNTFTALNDITWEVYRKEVLRNRSTWEYMKEATKFYILKFWLYIAYLDVRFRQMFGLSLAAYEADEHEVKF